MLSGIKDAYYAEDLDKLLEIECSICNNINAINKNTCKQVVGISTVLSLSEAEELSINKILLKHVQKFRIKLQTVQNNNQ